MQQQAMVVFEVLLHLDETRWFAGEERMTESSDQAVVQVGRIAESLVHILTDKMIDFVKLPGTAYESIPWLLGRLMKLVDFDADLLLTAAKACGSAERYDGLKAELYQGLDMLGGMEQGMDTIKATHTEVQAMLEAQGIDEDIAGILIEVQESLNMPLLAILLSIKSENDSAQLAEIPTEPSFIAVLPEERVVREMFLAVSEASYFSTFYLLRVVDKLLKTRFRQ